MPRMPVANMAEKYIPTEFCFPMHVPAPRPKHAVGPGGQRKLRVFLLKYAHTNILVVDVSVGLVFGVTEALVE